MGRAAVRRRMLPREVAENSQFRAGAAWKARRISQPLRYAWKHSLLRILSFPVAARPYIPEVQAMIISVQQRLDGWTLRHV